MKKSIQLLTILLVVFTTSWSQSPSNMSYQAVVRDANDKLVANSSIGMQISILQGSVNGTAVYVETHAVTSNGNGLVTMEIGGGTTVSGDLSGIDWSDGPYFLKTETDPSGGTNYSITGINELLSVPYAQYASSASSAMDDHDKDSTNELQSLSISNDTIFLSDGGQIVLPPEVDGSITNELQALSISNDTLYIQGGNFVYLGGLRDNDWVENGNHTYNDTDSIGIGTSSPDATLDVNGSFQYTDGNEARGKFLMSDSLGNASWDSLAQPSLIYSGDGSAAISWGNGDRAVINHNITLDKTSLVVVHFSGYARSGSLGTYYAAGIVFPGESLYHNSQTKVYQSLRQACSGANTDDAPISSTRSVILGPGTHLLRLEFASITNNSVLVYLGATRLTGYIIPLN